MFREKFQQLIAQQGWSDFSQIELLSEFIEDSKLESQAVVYLEQRAKEENESVNPKK